MANWKLFRRRGGSTVEFALTVPVIVGITGATMDYGYFFQQQIELTNITREGVRSAAGFVDDFEQTPCDVAATAVQNRLWEQGFHDDTQYKIVVEPDASIGANVASVTVFKESEVFFGFFPTPPSMTTSLRMMMELQNDELNCAVGS